MTQIIKLKSRLPDLNQQHLDLQSNALPNWAKAGRWVRPDLNRSLRLPKPKGSTKLPYGPTYKPHVDNILIIISINQYINVTIFWNNLCRWHTNKILLIQVYKCYDISCIINKIYIKNYILKPRTGIEPATTRLQVSRSTRLSHRGNMLNL